MTRPLYEPTPQRTDAYLNYQTEQLFRRPGVAPTAGSGCAVLFIKVFSDTQQVRAGDGKFIFMVSEDMDFFVLDSIESYVTTTSSSGDPTIQLANSTAAVDMLSTPCEIDSGDLNSKDASTQPVIDVNNDQVEWGDHISIDVDIAGTGAKGLGVILTFCPSGAVS